MTFPNQITRLAGSVSYATISENTAATNEIIAAVTSQKIIVLGLILVSAGTVTVTFKTGSTAICGAIPLVANSGFVMPYAEIGWMQTVAGEALNLTSDAAVQVSGLLTYITE